MMYFCPCPCNSAIDPETEESTFLALPRNLSYVQESYLDRHSVSARFAHNPKADLAQQLQDKRRYQDASDLDLEVGLDEDEKGDNYLDLNVIQSQQQFPACCSSSSEFQLHSPLQSSSSPIPVTRSPQTRAKLQSPDGAALASPGTGSFMSRVAASRLASFLSPKDEPLSIATDNDHDFSSSVDQPPHTQNPDNGTTPPDTSPPFVPDPALIHSPDHQGLKMDRGEDLAVGSFPGEEEDKMIYSSIVLLTSSSPNEISHVKGNDKHDNDMDGDEGVTLVLEDTESNAHAYGLLDAHTELASSALEESETLKPLLCQSDKTVFPGKEGRNPNLPPPLTLNPGGKDQNGKENGQTTFSESPDSDAFSEEGVFVNMMDDLDTNEKSATVSDVSDDTCVSVDSMFLSPDEEELQEKETPKEKSEQPRMSVVEAINRAASDLSKMSMMMYPDLLDSPLLDVATSTSKTEDRRKLARVSPVRQSKDLTIHLSYDNINSKSSSQPVLELPESPVYEDQEFNFNKKELRKSSSLKTNKTPPSTPHRKKVVRFADAMGLDLESVRHVLNMESPPRIPPSAMADLKQGLGEDRKGVGPRFLCPCFTQPGATDGFVKRVLKEKICLENAIITDLTITGFVRVANVCFNKNVRVRYTHNDWATFHDIAASYVLNSCDGPTDRFSFSIVAPAYFVTGNRLQFAVSFNAESTEYWDNNNGKNYAFECFAKPVPTENESAWIHFL